jgi:hypothetical protein
MCINESIVFSINFEQRKLHNAARHEAHLFTRLPERQAFQFCCLLALANRLGMRYDRIIRAYKRDLMRYEEVRT